MENMNPGDKFPFDPDGNDLPLEAGQSHAGRDMDLVEASAAEMLALAVRVHTPYFKSRVLRLAAEAYDLVSMGAAYFDGGEDPGADFDDDDPDDRL